ncbi:M91 family zinc metallopeptidase [Pseudomonas gessardii]|uniref:M91 family zinc metallopeptidase n=1 Tax=Pseudomonas gessardii TaxID=78544 RepID=UPI0014759B11|nr:M91 family zinc metallopeptidase [Pseudomonas gessardii]NNA68750.1 hypothetical protein [Pseudomonas gessardii]
MFIKTSATSTPTPGHLTTSLSNTPNAGAPRNPYEKVLADDGNVKILFKPIKERDPLSNTLNTRHQVQLSTTYRSDKVHISVDQNNKLVASVNGKDYKLPLSADNKSHSLNIMTGGGNDHVSIDKRVNIELHIDGGDGNDVIHAEGNTTTVKGGKGDDQIILGRGNTAALGGDGDDIMIAGSGNAVMSGGKGNDRLYVGAGPDNRVLYLNGDQGNDLLHAGPGTVVLNGGRGNDILSGYNQTTFYSGDGKDTIHSYNKNDKIYAKPKDKINNPMAAKVTHLEYAESGKNGLKIEGTPEFIEQMEDIVDRLRGSPVGQEMLKKMDQFVDGTRAPITVTEGDFEYEPHIDRIENLSVKELQNDPYPSEFGFIRNNQPGSVSAHSRIGANPVFFDKDFATPPEIAFQHELAHAYDGGTGTLIPGSGDVIGTDGIPIFQFGEPAQVENREYQAVGLPTAATHFDAENDPDNPMNSKNPAPLTENALRAEMGVPLRDRYDVDEAPRIG